MGEVVVAEEAAEEEEAVAGWEVVGGWAMVVEARVVVVVVDRVAVVVVARVAAVMVVAAAVVMVVVVMVVAADVGAPSYQLMSHAGVTRMALAATLKAKIQLHPQGRMIFGRNCFWESGARRGLQSTYGYVVGVRARCKVPTH